MKTNIEVMKVGIGKIGSHDLELYCGRGARPGLIPAGLGNPYPMKNESERDVVCELYERLLKSQPNHPHHAVIDRIAVRVQEGKSIGLWCFCAPKRCHCDTIKRLVEERVSQPHEA